MTKVKDKVELVFRQCIFIIINIYGLSKILGGQFYMNGNLPPEIAETTIGEASSFTLAWTFMGHSYSYVLIIGILQLLGAWFLLWNKTKLLGVIILIPIMLNIIIFDIIFLDVYPALANAIIVLSMLLSILFFNKEKIIKVYLELTNHTDKNQKTWKEKGIIIVITLLLIGLIFGIDTIIENTFGASKEKITLNQEFSKE